MGIISIFSFWPFLWASFLIFSFNTYFTYLDLPYLVYIWSTMLVFLRPDCCWEFQWGLICWKLWGVYTVNEKKKWNKDYWCLGCQNEMLGRWETIVLTPSFSLLPCMSASQCDKYISVLLPPQVSCSCFYHYTAKIHFIRSTLLTLCWMSFCIQNCFNSS